MCENAKLHSKSTKSIHEATIEYKNQNRYNKRRNLCWFWIRLYKDFKKCCEKCSLQNPWEYLQKRRKLHRFLYPKKFRIWRKKAKSFFLCIFRLLKCTDFSDKYKDVYNMYMYISSFMHYPSEFYIAVLYPLFRTVSVRGGGYTGYED